MSRSKTYALLAALLVLAPTAAAALMPDPATERAEKQDSLFRIINGMALVIGVVVEVLLVAFLVKFYRNRDVPRGESFRGNTKAEIAWTFAPVVVLVFIAYQSVVVMDLTDPPVDETLAAAAEDGEEIIEIKVYGNQFVWEYEYPDGQKGFGDLRVEEGRTYLLSLTARDVGHAFRVPEFGIMIDTWPNRWNHVFFTAPAYRDPSGADNGDYIPNEDPNTYFLQCQEYCGSGHAYMRGSIVVFEAGSQALPYGSAEGARPSCEEPLEGREVVDVVLQESGGTGGAPWSIDPSTMTLPAGASVRFRATIDGSGVHNFHLLDPVDQKTADFSPPGEECVDVDLPAEPQTIEYVCSIPGHAGLGMRGTLTLT